MTDTRVTGCTTLVLDILGTLVDESGSLRRAIAEALHGEAAPDLVDDLVRLWLEHTGGEQEAIAAGRRAYVASTALDREASTLVAERAGITSSDTIEALGAAGSRHSTWPDTIGALTRLAERYTLVGLSNASPAALTSLNTHTGMRWHQLLSADSARTFKPAPEVYELALAATIEPPSRVMMVAAHTWDLRGAAATGMRTAYVERPNGDPPRADDTFDLTASSLDDLADILLDS